ncbi:MAG: hypothetical protein DRN24_04765 [Thermoplasmata archaeon]|nr:MAG: hypothetical protein DRN24_04765 [Thermoplasmata archaeon]
MDKIKDIVLRDPDRIACLDEKEIENYIDNVIPLLEREKALIEIDGTTVFIGDTHGDFETTKAIVKKFLNMDHLVFLGDYIDREPTKWGSIYNITYLLLLKLLYHEKVILLKGNHECNYLIPCYPYEFEKEIIQRFGSSKLHSKYVEVFSSIPLITLTTYNVFAAHGGIIKGATLEQLRNIDKNDIEAVESIVWSDPTVSLTYRGAGKPFDEKDLTSFLDEIKAHVFVRGHSYNTLGFSIYNDRCLTIFSSQRYKNMGNGGILVAKVEKNVKYASDIVIEDFSTGEWNKYKIIKR